jgi:hypothetical protein
VRSSWKNSKGTLLCAVALARTPSTLGDEKAVGTDVLLRIGNNVALETEVGHARKSTAKPEYLIAIVHDAHILREEVLIEVEVMPIVAARTIVDERAELLQISIDVLLLADGTLIRSRLRSMPEEAVGLSGVEILRHGGSRLSEKQTTFCGRRVRYD